MTEEERLRKDLNDIINSQDKIFHSFIEILNFIRVQGYGYEINVQIDELKRRIEQSMRGPYGR